MQEEQGRDGEELEGVKESGYTRIRSGGDVRT